MSKKLVLDIDFDFDFRLWGIATPLRDYQACLLINRALKLQLGRQPDVELPQPEHNRLLLFSVFRYEDPMDKGTFHLVSNKYHGDYLMPEVREADFFFRFTGLVPDSYVHEIFLKLKNIDKFLAVIPLNAEKLKSRMNLLTVE
jgi:hypothetical protein